MRREVLRFILFLFFIAVVLFPTASYNISSDGDYKSPTIGPGYEQVQSGPGYVAPTVGPGYQAPTTGPGFISPEIGPGLIHFLTDNYTRQEINDTMTKVKNETTTLNDTIIQNVTVPKKMIDPLFVGTWRVFSDSIYYTEGGHKFRITPDTLIDIKNDSTWTYGTIHGTVSLEDITPEDWSSWGIKEYGPKRKIVFDGWNGAVGVGPVEEDIGGVSYFWIIYPDPVGMVWQKFGPVEDQRFIVEVAGKGKITSFDKQISCGIDDTHCMTSYGYGRDVIISATPETGSVFLGWMGACSGMDTECIVKMDQPRRVIALFGGGCTSNDECSLDEYCSAESVCSPVECACGTIQDHQCTPYACCSNTDCGAGMTCDATVHQCIQSSACTSLVRAGDSKDKLDLVFVGDGFNDDETLRKTVLYLMDYDKVFGGVLNVTPFKEVADKINVWMVTAPDYMYEENGDPDSNDYQRFVDSCERDTVVVVSRSMYRPSATFPTMGSSGGVVYLSLKFSALRGIEYVGNVLLHELGHAIGGLADEYVEYGKGTLYIENAPNCASSLESAKEKWGDLVGVRGVDYYTGVDTVAGTKYYSSPTASFPEIGRFEDGSDWADGGCSYDWSNIRPTISSLMKNQFEPGNDGYGPVNERVLKGKLEVFK